MAPRNRRESSSGGRTPSGGFSAGAKVEVRSDDEGFRGAWYEATVVRTVARRRCSVEYSSLVSDEDPSKSLREIVRRSHVRPPPPPPPPLSPVRYHLFQRVEAFHNDGWWAGVLSKLHGEDSGRFTVSFPTTREEVEFPPSEIRPLRVWVRGRWIDARDQEVTEPLFSVGAEVEVSRERENYGAAWFAATIGNMISNTIFLVDYKTLKAVTDGESLTEIVDAEYMRLPPPLASEDENFGLNDVVEVLYHGGWSPGVISRILNGSKYIVKLTHDEEEIEFNHSEMRSCQIWEDGQWINYSSQEKNRKSPMLGKAQSAGPRQLLHAGKRSSLPISVSTSSEDDDDDDATNDLLSDVLRLKRKKTEGLHTGGWIRSSQACRKLMQGKLFDYRLYLQGHFQSKTQLGVEEESPIAMPLLEDGLSSMDERLHFGSPSPERIGKKLPRKLSSWGLNYKQNVTEMNGIAESLNRTNEPFDFMCKGSEHQSKASDFNHNPVNDEASEFLPIREWGSCKGSRGPRESKRIKKLAVRAPHRQKILPDVISMKQHSQEEIKTRGRGRPPKRSIIHMNASMVCRFYHFKYVVLCSLKPLKQLAGIESKQLEDLSGQVAEEEHRRQEVELQNQGRSGDAILDSRAHGHHDEVMGHEASPLPVNMQDSPTSKAVSICQTDQGVDALGDRHTLTQIELLTRTDAQIKVSTPQELSFTIARSLCARPEAILTFDAPCNKETAGPEKGVLISVSKKDHVASCDGRNPGESPSKKTCVENKKALIDPSSSGSSLKKVILPFEKSSSMWESIEAMDIFHTLPQQPHFRPLEQYSIEFREGMAIGLMVSFANLAANIQRLNIGNNQSIFEERLNALGPFEANGFDVERLRGRLEELLERQSNKRQCEIKRVELEKKIAERKGDNDKLHELAAALDKAIMEVEQNLTRLQENRESVIRQRKFNDTEILKLQKDMQEVEEAFLSGERSFDVSLGSLW